MSDHRRIDEVPVYSAPRRRHRVSKVGIRRGGAASSRMSPVQDRAHFYAGMSLYIRSALVDHARARQAAKRGGGGIQVSLSDALADSESMVAEVLALDQSLRRLAALDPRCADVLHLNCFAGLDRQQIAEVLAGDPLTFTASVQPASAGGMVSFDAGPNADECPLVPFAGNHHAGPSRHGTEQRDLFGHHAISAPG